MREFMLATAFCNRIHTPDDVAEAVNGALAVEEVIAALAIKGDKMAVAGDLEMRIFKNR